MQPSLVLTIIAGAWVAFASCQAFGEEGATDVMDANDISFLQASLDFKLSGEALGVDPMNLAEQASTVNRMTQAECEDTPNWLNNEVRPAGHRGFSCRDYEKRGWCANGAFVPGKEWTGDEAIGDQCATKLVPTETYPTCAAYYNYPGRHCCVCGKANGDEDGYLSELTLLAGSADDDVNLTAAAMEELGWAPGVMISDTTHKPFGMEDHAWTFSKGGKCVAVFAATNDDIDMQQVLGGLAVDPIELCGFQIHAGVADEMAGFMNAPKWLDFITFLNSPTCTSVTAVGHSLGGAVATVFAGCANVGGMNGNFGQRTDYGLVTFAPFAASTSPIYSGTPGTPFKGVRYSVTTSDGGASSKTSLPDDTKQFRMDLLQLYIGFANATQNPALEQLQQAHAQFAQMPADQIEPAWDAQIESSLVPFLPATLQIASGTLGLEELQSAIIATLTGMAERGELFFSYDTVSGLSAPFGFKHPLVDFQALPHPLKDGPATRYPKVDAASAPELPKQDAFQSLFATLGSGEFLPNHAICCYSTASDCSSKFTVDWKGCRPEPWR